MTVYLPTDQKYIDRLTGIIEKNFSNQGFGVTELTEAMGVSHSSLHRKLKSLTGQSISQFIRVTRLNRAKELLQQQAGTVAEVSYEVGFGSTTYFSKCFHDHFGYPPGEVKKLTITGAEIDKQADFQEIFGSHIKSIAVLPFDNYTGDDDQSFLIYGMHDALIGELGKLGSIRVVSKTSVLAYANSEKTIKKIATELEVDAIIEASVLVVEGKLRIQLKLFNALPEEKQLWAQSFDVEMGEILKLYGQVIRNVASEIQYTLTPEQQAQLDEIREVNPDSYRAYLRGKYNIQLQTPEGVQKGLEYLHQAVSIDPAEPLGYAGLALGYMDIAHGPFNAGDAYLKAESAAKQALRLDPGMAEAQLANGQVYTFSKWDFSEGEKHFKQALELNPNLSLAHYSYSWLLYLLGRNEESLYEHELAWKCDPFNPLISSFLGAMYAYTGHYDEAFKQAERTFEIIKDFPIGYFIQGETYMAMGQVKEAIAAYSKLADLAPPWAWFLGYALALNGHQEEAQAILSDLEKAPISGWNAMGLAVMYGALGMFDEAFKWIGYKPHHVWIPWVAVMPMWKPLHNDPRHGEFVRSLKLSQKTD